MTAHNVGNVGAAQRVTVLEDPATFMRCFDALPREWRAVLGAAYQPYSAIHALQLYNDGVSLGEFAARIRELDAAAYAADLAAMRQPARLPAAARRWRP